MGLSLVIETGDGVGESIGIDEEPCKKRGTASAIFADAVAEGRPVEPGRSEPVGQPGSRSVACVTPTSGAGRLASPIEQGRVALDAAGQTG